MPMPRLTAALLALALLVAAHAGFRLIFGPSGQPELNAPVGPPGAALPQPTASGWLGEGDSHYTP
jgi:hypothetical protein